MAVFCVFFCILYSLLYCFTDHTAFLQNAGDLYRQMPFRSPVYFINRRMNMALQGYLAENHFDIIIMTHLFPADESREAVRRRLGLEADKRYILIIGGSMGGGKIEKVIMGLRSCIVDKEDVDLIIICGCNKVLFDKLNDDDIGAAMTACQRSCINPCAAARTCELAEGMVESKGEFRRIFGPVYHTRR